MEYFVKTTFTGEQWFWCYATAATSVGRNLVITEPCVPVAGGSLVSLYNKRLIWPSSDGWLHAYPIEPPEWLANSGRNVLQLPKWLPPAVRNGGIQDAVEFALRGSPLRNLFEREEVRRVVAEDLALEKASAILHSPVFIPEYDELHLAWAAARPQAHEFARADGELVASTLGMEGGERELRIRWRMEAHRKIDAVREDFRATPSLGAEPYIEVPTDAGVLRVGNVAKGHYPQGDGVEPVNPRCRVATNVDAVESAIWPGPANWSDKVKWLPWMHRFQAFEAKSPLPALRFRPWCETIDIRGFEPRIPSAGSATDLAAVGIYPYLAQPAKELVASGLLALSDMSPIEAATACLQRAWRAAA